MFHALDFMGVDFYISYNILVEEEESLENKDFVLAMVDKILEISTTLRYSSTRSVHEKRLKAINSTLSTIVGLC